jgi:hypothetical protein
MRQRDNLAAPSALINVDESASDGDNTRPLTRGRQIDNSATVPVGVE